MDVDHQERPWGRESGSHDDPEQMSLEKDKESQPRLETGKDLTKKKNNVLVNIRNFIFRVP